MHTSGRLLSAAVAALAFSLIYGIEAAYALRLAAPDQQQQGPHQALPQPQEHAAASAKPQPPVWPEQFKAALFQNRTGILAMVTLYYDWKLKANLNIIASQLGTKGTIWDLEWNNGTSFIFSRDKPFCKTIHFEVGILTPDWLGGSRYLGPATTDNFTTHVWTKAHFIDYYADQVTTRPVRWDFLWTSAEFHTMEWDEGATLPDNMWQAPPYCFTTPSQTTQQQQQQGQQQQLEADQASLLDSPLATGRLLRPLPLREQASQEH